MRKILVLLLLLFSSLHSFTQGFQMHVDSTNVFSSGPYSFVAYRAIIVAHKISHCKVYAVFNGKVLDSILIKQVWFDSAGNMAKCAIIKSGNPDSVAYSSSFSFDEASQPLSIETIINNDNHTKSYYHYYKDTTELVNITYYLGGEKVYFPINNMQIEKKAGWDTTYTQFVFNQNKQLVSSTYLDGNRKPIFKTILSYDAKGLPYKCYTVGNKKQKQYKFYFTHEFADGQYVMMKWDDGPHRMMKNDMACFYRNNQCFKCTQPFGTFWEYFYTPEGLLKEERQHINNEHTVSYKYYYF